MLTLFLNKNRLVKGAEENIYESLKWAGLIWDEGPIVGGPYGPYRQSDRAAIYAKYAEQLINSGHAYRCFCSKDRLDKLKASAQKLHPPSMASYDRKCSHLTPEESKERTQSESFTVRFKTPVEYPEFHDILHGKLNLQTQVNHNDLRYDDPVLVKSDGLPTYHLANVVDDHLMKITHVIRGEEWLPSTPKHIAMYKAFGWNPPKFVHIPLLTSASDKKLSKRSGDIGVLSLAKKGILPEAMVNFVALFGWSPHKDAASGSAPPHNSEIYTLDEMVKLFTLHGLTKGNAKVTDKKLLFLNKHYFAARLSTPSGFQEISEQVYAAVKPFFEQESDIPDSTRTSFDYTANILRAIKDSVTSLEFFTSRAHYLYVKPELESDAAKNYVATLKDMKPAVIDILQYTLDGLSTNSSTELDLGKARELCDSVADKFADKLNKGKVFQALRYALTGSVPGVDIPSIISLLGADISKSRLETAINKLKN